jgi:hypothetical protein
MSGTGYLPDNDVSRIVRLDLIGVKRRDVTVIQAVNEQNRSPRAFNRPFRRCFLHVQSVAKPNVKKSRIHRGPKKGAAEPGACMKLLTKSRVSDFAKACEWTFGNHCAKTMFLGQRLQQLSCSHRFSQAIHAAWTIGGLQPVQPAMNVVGFF